jgi:hypothetical protein
VTWLVVGLVVAVLAAIGWLMLGTRHDQHAEQQARTRAQRERDQHERTLRRRRLGLPPIDEDDAA